MAQPPRHPARILDASANRAREALRVLEDGARVPARRSSAHRGIQATPSPTPESWSGPSLRACSSTAVRWRTTRDGPSPPPGSSFVRTPRRWSERRRRAASESLRSLEEWSKTIRPENRSWFRGDSLPKLRGRRDPDQGACSVFRPMAGLSVAYRGCLSRTLGAGDRGLDRRGNRLHPDSRKGVLR